METKYIDTNVALWLVNGNKQIFSTRAKNEINNSKLLISPMVILEFKYLEEIGRVTTSPERIVKLLYTDFHIEICDKPFLDIIKSSISFDFTRDPFDRIITAHAALENSKLITKDQFILDNYKNAIW